MTRHDVGPSGHSHVRGAQRRPRARFLGAALALLALPGPLMAGFDTCGGKALSFGDGSDSDANKAKIQGLVDQLMKPIDESNPWGQGAGFGMTQAQAEQRVKEIRENVKKAVELAKLRMDATRAKFLDEQFKNGNICIGWGMKARGGCNVDPTAEKLASEKIVLSPHGLLGGPLPVYDPRIVVASGTLFHENTHAGQSWVGTVGPNPTEDEKKIAKGLAYVTNEAIAHDDNYLWLDELLEILAIPESLDPTHPIPPGTNPAVAAILQAIKQIADPEERAKAREKLVWAMIEEFGGNSAAVACFAHFIVVFQQFLLGLITIDDVRQELNDATWKYYSSQLGDFTVVREELPGTIRQLGVPGPGPAIDTGLQRIQDFFVLPFSSSFHVLLVTGKTVSGLGELQAYGDTNGDWIFEPATKTVLFTSSTQLMSNMCLFRDDATGTMYIYDGVSRLIHELVDTNSDGVPNALGSPVNSPDPRLADYVAFEFMQGATFPTILAYHQEVSMAPAMPFDDTTLRLRDLDGDGNFETIDEPSFDSLLLWAPTFDANSFEHLAPSLLAYAPPSSLLQVWLTDDAGHLLQFRGSGVGQGAASPAPVTLFPPFQYGEQMVIVDDTLGSRSPNALLSPWKDLGDALLGTKGFPELTGSGVLSAGSSISLALANAPPLQPSAFIVGLSAANIPFKGGTLVPAVDLLLTGLPTNSTGHLTLSAAWPATIPPGFEFFFQHWLHDPGGIQGFTASNAVVGTSS